VYATLNDLDVALSDLIRWSRPASLAMRTTAINVGYRKCIRAVTQVRPERFLQEQLFTLPGRVYRIPLRASDGFRPIQRIKMIQVFDPGSAPLASGVDAQAALSLRFSYASVESDIFQLAQAGGALSTDWVYYDLLFPIIQTNGSLDATPTLAVAPALAQDIQVLIESIYHPLELTDVEDPVEPVIQAFGEVVLQFAMAWLLQTVNDVEAGRWAGDGMAGLAELRDAVAQVSQQNTEALDTGLWFTGDS